MILLDTCTLLWLCDPDVTLPDEVTRVIRKTSPSERYVSAISAFEIGFKHALGRLQLSMHPKSWFEQNLAARGLRSLPITDSIAMRASQLPRHHRDPADRFIISTAMEYNLRILTPDEHFSKYAVQMLWHSPSDR